MSEFGTFPSQTEIEPVPQRSSFSLNEVGLLRKLMFMTERGGFSCVTIPWNSYEESESDETLCVRAGAVGELEEEMDWDWFVLGGAEQEGAETEVGVVRRGQPLLYRPVRIMPLETAKTDKNLSDEGVEFLRSQGLVRGLMGDDVYLDAPNLYATGRVASVHLFDSNGSFENQASSRLI